MVKRHRLKTFVNPSHKALEDEFNNWNESQVVTLTIINTSMVYSSSLQKFVFSVVYTVSA